MSGRELDLAPWWEGWPLRTLSSVVFREKLSAGAACVGTNRDRDPPLASRGRSADAPRNAGMLTSRRRPPAAIGAKFRDSSAELTDAGMRELWATGWMHNRVRMIVASFLAKHLLIDWGAGEAWFWDALVGVDPADNAAVWQWAAGCGADAAPYFRIFNPVLQGQKFDPDGTYVRRWASELAKLPAAAVQRPWEASADELASAGVRPGETYPHPLVGHDEARRRALEAFSALS
jgi:deoxyribodipyrimidine photo-lyase